MPLLAPPQPGTQIFPPLRPRKQSFCQRAKIESRPACHNGEPAAFGNLSQRRARLPAVIASSEWLVGISHINQVMRNARPFLRRWLCRTEIHPAIDSNRIAADNLAVKSLAEREGKRRLPTPRGSQENYGQRLRFWWRIHRWRNSKSQVPSP